MVENIKNKGETKDAVVGSPLATSEGAQGKEHTVIKPQQGRYRHFKGKEYEVLYIARHSETLEEMVVYKALYGEQGIWVRPVKMFCEEITRDGKTFKRFEKI